MSYEAATESSATQRKPTATQVRPKLKTIVSGIDSSRSAFFKDDLQEDLNFLRKSVFIIQFDHHLQLHTP